MYKWRTVLSRTHNTVGPYARPVYYKDRTMRSVEDVQFVSGPGTMEMRAIVTLSCRHFYTVRIHKKSNFLVYYHCKQCAEMKAKANERTRPTAS